MAPRAATLTKPIPPKSAVDWAAVRVVAVVDRLMVAEAEQARAKRIIEMGFIIS